MTPEIKKITNQYAGEYGFFVGILWIATFLLYAEGISRGNMLMASACLLTVLLSLFVTHFLVVGMNRKLFAIGERFSYWRAYQFSMTMLFCASLLTGAFTYVYLEFINDGQMMAQIIGMLKDPEVAAVYKQMNMGDQYAEVMRTIGGLTSWDFSFSIFSNWMLLSLLGSFYSAYIGSYDMTKVVEQMRKKREERLQKGQ